MSFYNENCSNRILELLNCPVPERCPELTLLFDRCSIRELQEIFLPLINSIFGINSGAVGWGLRTTTRENSPQNYEILYQFFIPLGPMFRLCYRLLNDAIKFDFPVELLPRKTSEMILSGNYSMFYADLITIDPFRRTVSTLSLNAFDYFILSFAIHGTTPLHRMYPQALQVHNERLKTAYFWLTADYLCSFLPTNPDAVVLPTNICGTVKAPQPMPVQPLQPTRSPKYLKLSPISHFTNTSNQTINQRSPESPRAYAWRTESVLYLFIDIWVRFDVDETMELPSSEFVRSVRILVKQIHAFGNSADLDNTSMAILRKQSQPMMRARIYPFLKSLIGRWPLDSSLSVVLELWLSYIQPWRYTFDRDYRATNLEIPITNKYELFISENLPIYTQIFVQILPRFERLDFTTHKNALMLSRLVKVFSQDNLLNILCTYEQRRPNSFSPIISPPHINTRTSSFYSPQRQGVYAEWENIRHDGIYHEEIYIPMFGDEIRNEVQDLLKKVCIARFYVQQEIEALRKEIAEQNRGLNYLKRLIFSIFDDVSPAEVKLFEMQKTPELLNICVNTLCIMFEVNMPDLSIEHIEPREISYSQVNFACSDTSENLDISKISPFQMRNAIYNIQPNMDPALFPIQSHECKFLVRFLHQVSCKLNEMFEAEMAQFWVRNDIWGKLSRQILNDPMTVQWFDKQKGYSELREERLPPRICLRILASYRTLVLIGISLLAGHLLWKVPSFGLLLLVAIIFMYLFIRALIT